MQRTFIDELIAKREELSRVTDNLGMPIEAGIFETVVVLQALGFATSGSCEGHIDWGCPWPWVNVEANKPMPLWRWEGEEKARSEIMAELGLSEKDFKPGIRTQIARKEYNERRWDWVHQTKPQETHEYLLWLDGFHQEYLRLKHLIDAFERDAPCDVQLVLQRMGIGTWMRLEVVDRWSCYDEGLNRNCVPSEKDHEVRLERLSRRQIHMQAFTTFLMKEFVT